MLGEEVPAAVEVDDWERNVVGEDGVMAELHSGGLLWREERTCPARWRALGRRTAAPCQSEDQWSSLLDRSTNGLVGGMYSG